MAINDEQLHLRYKANLRFLPKLKKQARDLGQLSQENLISRVNRKKVICLVSTKETLLE